MSERFLRAHFSKFNYVFITMLNAAALGHALVGRGVARGSMAWANKGGGAQALKRSIRL